MSPGRLGDKILHRKGADIVKVSAQGAEKAMRLVERKNR